MSKQKTERLLSLVVCLLSTSKYLTAVQIRDAVPGYPAGYDSFKRMFERDKDELRELGIPLEIGFNSGSDEEAGYRIPRQAYELPEIRLEPDEAAVLGLAARVWRRAELGGAAAGGLLKLRAAGIDADEANGPGIEPRLETGETAFGALWQAVRDGRPVSFSYQAAGRTGFTSRDLEPWGVVNRHGRWYVVGLDTGRGEQRVFRLDRIGGEVSFTGPPGTVKVPADVSVQDAVRASDGAPPPPAPASLRIRQGTGHGLRRRAAPAIADPDHPGWDLVRGTFTDTSWYADWIASFGADVIVVEPPDLREAVIRRLKGALA